MQTVLHESYINKPGAIEAESVIRNCVHCGFCLATCPTYQLTGNELDSPRGRIYLIKQLFEGHEATQKTQSHLDRCLTCRACESTCPSGVDYSHLLDIGRHEVEQALTRPAMHKLIRWALRTVLPNRRLLTFCVNFAQLSRRLLPERLKKKLPQPMTKAALSAPNAANHPRRMLLLQGCVQPALKPTINQAAKRIFDKLGITLVEVHKAGCCGALAYHLNAQEAGLQAMRRLIDAWWPFIADKEQAVEAIVFSASGCGVTIKDYGYLLRYDTDYAEKAARVSALGKDLSEILEAEWPGLALFFDNSRALDSKTLAFHTPCTLQHGLKLGGKIETLLKNAGFHITEVDDAHLCCGSAGTYSLLQRELSGKLLAGKIEALTRHQPELIATANIGCVLHLESETQLPVKHWIEILDQALCE